MIVVLDDIQVMVSYQRGCVQVVLLHVTIGQVKRPL